MYCKQKKKVMSGMPSRPNDHHLARGWGWICCCHTSQCLHEEWNIKPVIVWAGRHKTWASAVPCWWTLRLGCHRCQHWLFRDDPKHGSTVSSSHILDWGPFRGQRLLVRWFFCAHWSLSYFLLSFHFMAWLKSVFILLWFLILQTLTILWYPP